MVRRTVTILVLSLLVAIGLFLGGGYWSVKQAPAFYTEEIRKPVDPVQRKEQAKAFVQATMQLVDELKHDESWSEEFTQDEVNAWLAEELPRKFPGWIPPNTSDPRVRFEKDAVELAFQSDDPQFKGVISGRFEPFVAGPNQIGVRIHRVRLGLVPLPIAQVIDQIEEPLAEAVAEAGMIMRWQQLEGEDVLVLELRTETDRPVLEHIQVDDGTLAVSGSRRRQLASTRTPRIVGQ